MKLFRAIISDVYRIEECARLCCQEHGRERMGGDLDWFGYRRCLEDALSNCNGAMWLYEDDGRIVAGFCGGKFQEPLTGLWRATQIFLYAMPEYRGRISIRELFNRFEEWAALNGCKNIVMPLLDTMPPSTASLYKRLGYIPQQTNYLKRIGP